MMKVKWSQIVEKYLGKPYELGGWGKPGYDCFSILITLMRDIGINIPQDSKWKGIKLTDYNHIWEENKSKARKTVIAAISQYLIKHDGPVQQGDVVLISCGKEESFLGLFTSNRIISVDKKNGVKAYPLKYFTIHNKYRMDYELS